MRSDTDASGAVATVGTFVAAGAPSALGTTPAPRSGAPLPPRPRSRKGAPRPVPQRADTLAHLSLDGVRGYRKALSEEESRVSYWRRIVQARLDVLRAGVGRHDVAAETLRPVLTDARVGAGRRALIEIVPVDDIPPLPHLEELWNRQVDDEDLAGLARLEADLERAERQLSDYRAALHRRIGEATNELIARYREEPTLCLSALPLPPQPRSAAS